MRFKTLSASAAIVMVAGLSVPQAANAADPLYTRVDIGAAFSTGARGNIFNGSGFGQDFGTSPVIGIGIGKPLSDVGGVSLRGEVEARFHSGFDAPHTAPNATGTITLGTNADVRSWTLMGNLYADFARGDWRPYLGVGAGIAFNRLDTLTYTFNNVPSATEPGTRTSPFAWSLMAGIGYKMSNSATLDIGYKYLDAGKVASSGLVTLTANGTTYTQPAVTDKLRAHELTVGVRFSF
jgi:opacity protein-like surface antigen